MHSDEAAERDLENWQTFRGRLGDDARATAVYRLKLAGPTPDKLAMYPKNLRTGNAASGEAMLRGVWNLGREDFSLPEDYAPWDRAVPSRHYADRLHRFHWLKHLTELGPEGNRRARQLVEEWVDEFGKWNGFVWRLPVTVDRVWNWLCCGPILFDNLAPDSDVLQCLVRQARHITHSADEYKEPAVKLRAVMTQILMAFALDEAPKKLPMLEGMLEFMLNDHVLADGGHVSRNPEALLELLLDIQTIDELYLRTGRPSLPFISRLVPRIAGMLRFLQTGDGGLPVMNGGSEGNRADLYNALQPYAASRTFAFATKSAIHKLEAGDSRLMLDAGHAPAPDHALEAHAGCLSFEFESGGERIITGCGSHPDIDPVWRSATRRTDGHSTLVLAGANASEFIPYRPYGVEVPMGPTGVSARRMEEQEEVLLDAQHAGWKDSYGLIYRRRVFMDQDGHRLTGEDSLFRPVSAGLSEQTDPIAFDVRFHLHPDVKIEPDEDKLQLVLPSGQVWLFKTTHEPKAIERTVYLARGNVENSWQLVLSADADPNGDGKSGANLIKWALVKAD